MSQRRIPPPPTRFAPGGARRIAQPALRAPRHAPPPTRFGAPVAGPPARTLQKMNMPMSIDEPVLKSLEKELEEEQWNINPAHLEGHAKNIHKAAFNFSAVTVAVAIVALIDNTTHAIKTVQWVAANGKYDSQSATAKKLEGYNCAVVPGTMPATESGHDHAERNIVAYLNYLNRMMGRSGDYVLLAIAADKGVCPPCLAALEKTNSGWEIEPKLGTLRASGKLSAKEEKLDQMIGSNKKITDYWS